MKMTKILGALTAGLILAACQMPTTGAIRIAVDGQSVGRSIEGTGTKARIQLFRNGTLVPLGGQDFAEDGLAGRDIVIDGIPTGTGYSLNLATGTSNGAYFEVAYAGSSTSFEVAAGVDTSVAITLNRTPVDLLFSGTGPHKSIAIDGVASVVKGTDYYDAADYQPDTVAADFGTGTAISLGGRTLNSLGEIFDKDGVSVLTLNTSDGIGLLDGSFQNAGQDVRNTVAYSQDGYVLNFYSGLGLTAGLQVLQADSEDNDWFDLQTELDLPDSITGSIGEGAAGLIRGFGKTEKFAYLSTALTTFRIDTSMFSEDADVDALENLIQKFKDGADDVKIAVKLGGKAVAIGPVSAFGTETSGIAFAGTSRGVFSADTDSLGRPVGGYDSLSLVSGTYGLDIKSLTTTSFGGDAYTAAFAGNTGDLVVLQGRSVLKIVPRLAGLPSGALDVSWWKHGSALQLLVSGDNGTVAVDVAVLSD